MVRKIVYISLRQYGYSSNHESLTKYLAENYQVYFISPDHFKRRVDPDSVIVYYLTNKSLKKFLSESLSYLDSLNLGQNDVITYVLDSTISSSIMGLILCIKCQCRKIADVRTVSVHRYAFRRTVENFMLKLAVSFIGESITFTEEIAREIGINGNKNFIVPLATNLDKVRLQERRKGSKNFLYVGSLAERNLDQYLEAIRLVLDKDNSFNFKLIGYGEKARKELIAKSVFLNIDANVEILGEIYGSELMGYLRWADYGVSYVPVDRRYDLQPPTKVLDYAIYGLPVLATATRGTLDLCKAGNFALLVGDDPRQFAMGCLEIVNKNWIASDIQRSAEPFTVAKIVRHYNMILNT